MNTRLKKVKKKFKKNQNDFAKLLKIALRTYQKYESGEREPIYSVISRLAELGIDMNWFITGKGDMFEKEVMQGVVAEDRVEYGKLGELVKKNEAQIKEKAVLDRKIQSITERLEELDSEARDMILESFITILKASNP